MNRIDQTFARLKRARKKALIGYVTAGFPTKAGFAGAIRKLEKAGLDLLEIGVPFSDPVADGITIQRASQKVLQFGVTLAWILKEVKALRRDVKAPIILMTYCNPILAMGLPQFFAQARVAGVDGVIIPDLIPEEGKAYELAARKNHLNVIYLVTPTTPGPRAKRIAQATRGFLYAVSLTGITGARSSLGTEVPRFLSQLRRTTAKPIAVGFGISKPEHVQTVRRQVDGIIVGSALINHLEISVRSAEAFVSTLQRALNPGHKGANHAS